MPHILIVGGGASGLMAAGTAIKNGCSVTVIEKNSRPARKVMITGKGRCNLTNNTDLNGLIANVTANGKFLYSAFSAFSANDVMLLVESLGVPLKTERGNRVFPQSDKAVDVVDALVKYSKGAKFITASAKSIICKNGEAVGVMLDNGESIYANKVIIASGGLSYPTTGSTGDGYKMAQEVGHSIEKLSGSLVPLQIHEGFCAFLQGISLKNISVKMFEEGKSKPAFSGFGEMLFTHFGVSGPLILSASAHIKDGKKYYLTIDLKPALDTGTLDARIIKDFNKYSSRDIINALDDLLLKKLIPVIIKLSEIDPHKKVCEITKQERTSLLNSIKALTLHITEKRPVEEAVVTKGGITLSEVNPGSMESKICKNLYFAGEILNVDAYTGGFNLQIAFSTGYLAALSASKE